MSAFDDNFAYALVSSSERTLMITGVNPAKYHAGNVNWGSIPAIPALYAGGTLAYNGYGASENAFAVVEIANGAFNGRTEFAEGPLVLSNALVRIGDNAFNGVKLSGRLTIPASVTHIGANAFAGTLIDELVVENETMTDLLSGVVDATRVTSKEIDARVATDATLNALKVPKANPVFTGTTVIPIAAISAMTATNATVQTANVATVSVTNTATIASLTVNGGATLAGSGTVTGNWNFNANAPNFNAQVMATESFTQSKIKLINGAAVLTTVQTLADVATAIGSDPQFAVNAQMSQTVIIQSIASLSTRRSTDVSSLSSALSVQVSALQSADVSLSSAISGTVPVRVSQLESVSTVLQTAVSQMQSTDVSTSTVLSEATSLRASQTVSLNAAISTAASLLQNADTALSTSLSAATLTRSLNISANSSTWSAHVSTLQTADASLSTAIEGIAPARSSAITSLSSLVSTTVPVLESGNATFHAALSDHTVNRVASVAALSDAISAQVSTTQGLNAGLLPQITAAASVAPDATTSTVFNLLGLNVNDSVTFRKTGGGGAFATGNRIVVTYSPTDYLKGTVTAVSGSDITFTVNQKATAATETTVYTTTGAFGVSTASSTGSHVVPLTTPAFVAAGSNYVITSMTGALFSSTHTNQYTVSLLDASDAVIATAPSLSFTTSQDVRTHAFTSAFVLKGATNLKQKFSHGAGASTQILVNYTDFGAFTTMKGYAVDYSSGVVCIESNGALQSTRISAIGALSASALGQVGSLSTVISANRSDIALQTGERSASVSSILSATAQSMLSLQAVTSAHGSAATVAVSERNASVVSLTGAIDTGVSALSLSVASISTALSAQIVNRSTQVLTAVTSLVGAAPASLDTLFEIAATLDAGPVLYSTLDSTETALASGTATSLTVTAGENDYVINGVSKPVLTLIRGSRYTFTIGAGGHPFYFQTSGLSYNPSLVYSPTGPKVVGIATQYVAVGTGVGSSANGYSNWASDVSGAVVIYADYRLRFSNGVISDLILTPNRAYQGTLVNPDISFALTNIPAVGVTAILQGRNSDLPANGWFDVNANISTKVITPGTTIIKFSGGGNSGTSFFAATPVMSTATIVFDVPNDAPNTLTYVSQDKPNMGNTVNVFNNTRINEVAAVSASLSAAVSTLQLADASLSAGISAAVSVRTSQAASVSSGVSAFISFNQSTQSATSAGISATASLRASGVTSISTSLSTLASAAQLSDLSASNSIAAAISVRQSGMVSASALLSGTVLGFQTVDAGLSAGISTAALVRQSETASVSTLLSSTVSGQHQAIASLSTAQSVLIAGINVSALANLAEVDSAIGAVAGVGAVTALDTLNEIALAINNDATFGTTLTGLINGKANQSDVAALNSGVLLKASQADLTQLVDTVETKAGSASVSQMQSAVSSMTVVATSVSGQVQILQTNMTANSQTLGMLSDTIRQMDALYEYTGSVDANGSIIYAVNKLSNLALQSSSLAFTFDPSSFVVTKVTQVVVVQFDPTQTSVKYSSRGVEYTLNPISLTSGTNTYTFNVESSSTSDYATNATNIVITANPTTVRSAPANSPFTVPKLALSSFTHATPTVVTPYAATTWSDATGKISQVITINFELGVQHLFVGGTVFAVAGTTQYVHTLEYLPGANPFGQLNIKTLSSATKFESALLSLSNVYNDYLQHAAPAEVGGSKTVTVSESTYTYAATYATAASMVELQTYNTATSTYASSDVAVVGGQVSVSRSYLVGQIGQPLFQLRAKTGDGKRYSAFVVATAEAITFSKPTLTPNPVNPVYTTLSPGSYRATFTYTVHPLATAVKVINPSTAGTYIASQAASGGSVTFSVDYTEAQSISIAVITLANSGGLQSVASDAFVPLGQYDPPVYVDGSREVTFNGSTYNYTAQYTSASPDGIKVYDADGVTHVGSSTGTSSPFTVTTNYGADKIGQTAVLLRSKGTVNKRESATTTIVGEDIPTYVTPVISGGITYGTSGANITAQMNYTVSYRVDQLAVLKSDQTQLPAGTSVQQSIVSTTSSATGATRLFSVTVTFPVSVSPLNITVVAEANSYGKRSAASAVQIVMKQFAAPANPSGPVYTTVSAGSYTASMTYTLLDAEVIQVQVRKASDNTPISGATSSINSLIATITVPFTDAESPVNIVVVALGNASGRESAASATQTFLKQFAAPVKASEPVYTTVSAGSYTASMTYTVAAGVTAVQVRKASDNSAVSGATSSITLLTATITVPFTDAASPLDITVVALANSAGRESAASATQTLIKQFAAPTLSGNITYSGTPASMTYTVAAGVTAVQVRKASDNTPIAATTSVSGTSASVSVTFTDSASIVVVALGNASGRESAASATLNLVSLSTDVVLDANSITLKYVGSVPTAEPLFIYANPRGTGPEWFAVAKQSTNMKTAITNYASGTSAPFIPSAFGQTSPVPFNNIVTTLMTDMYALFQNKVSFNHPIASWDTGAVTSMAQMFYGATAFNQPIDKWNTGAVITMAFMFYNATAFNQPIGAWNTGAVIYMTHMFYNASAFNQNISAWNVSNVSPNPPPDFSTGSGLTAQNIPAVFLLSLDANTVTVKYVGSAALVPTSEPLFIQANPRGTVPEWFAVVKQSTNMKTAITNYASGTSTPFIPSAFGPTSPVPFNNIVTTLMTDMSLIFINKTSFNSPIASWDTSNVTNMISAFYAATSFNQPIGAWNTSSVTDMNSAFYDATSFNQPIGAWNTSNVTNMVDMFRNSLFNQNIGSWNTSNVTNMVRMFYNASAFNQNISAWNTSKVTNMSSMFGSATVFNQPIGAWNTGAVTNMIYMFNNASAFNQNISAWNTSNVTNMTDLFFNARAFNQPIGAWNTSNVTNMTSLFFKATAFNQDISAWNTSKVITMDSMFIDAVLFNQPIGAWNTGAVTNMNYMFYNASAFNQNISAWNVSNVSPKPPTEFSTNSALTAQSSPFGVAFAAPIISNSGIVTYSGTTASMTYTVATGVTAVQVRKASDNTPVSGATSSITSLTATITVPFTDANSPLNVVVVALGNAAGRESAASATQTLLKQFAAPTLSGSITYSGNTASMTYTVPTGVTAVQVMRVRPPIPTNFYLLTAAVFNDGAVSPLVVNTNLMGWNIDNQFSSPGGGNRIYEQMAFAARAVAGVLNVNEQANLTVISFGGSSNGSIMTITNLGNNNASIYYYNTTVNVSIPGYTPAPNPNITGVNITMNATTATITVPFAEADLPLYFVVAALANAAGRESAASATQTLIKQFAAPVKASEPVYTTVSAGSYTASMTYTVAAGVTQVHVAKASDINYVFSNITVIGTTATLAVPFTDADSPVNIVVIAIANAAGRGSAASATQTWLKQFAAPVKASEPVYTTVSAGSYTASMTYTVAAGVTQVQVRKASDNTAISGATTSVSGTTVTLAVPFTDADSPLNVVVVAIANSVGRESAASATQTLLKQFAAPTLSSSITYSGTTANMTYTVASGVSRVSALKASDTAYSINNPSVIQPLTNFPMLGETYVWTFTITEQLGTASLLMSGNGYLEIIFESNRVAIFNDTSVKYTEYITSGFHDLPRPTTFTLSFDNWTYLIRYDNNTKTKVFPSIHNVFPQISTTYNNITYTGPVTIKNSQWQMLMAFRSTGGNNTWRALIGDMRNLPNNSFNNTGWGIRISNANNLYFSWSNNPQDVWDSGLSVAQDTDYVLAVIYDRFTSIRFELTNVSTNTTVSATYSSPLLISGHGPAVTVGGWINSPTENFVGTISYVNVVPTLASATASSGSATLTVPFTELQNVQVEMKVVALANSAGRGSAASASQTLGLGFPNDYTSLMNYGGITQPNGIAFNGSDQVIISLKNGGLQVFNYTYGILQNIYERGTIGSSGTANGLFSQPGAIALDKSKNIVVADTGNKRIQMFTITGTHIRSFGSSGTGNGQFMFPSGVAVSSDNHIYVSDSTNHNVQRFNNTGAFIHKFGSAGSANGQFNFASSQDSIAIDKSDNIYVVDGGNNRVQVFNKFGTYLSQKLFLGETPQAIAIDATEKIIIAFSSNVIRIHDKNWNYMYNFGSTGAGAFEFNYIAGIAVDPIGKLHVADRNNGAYKVFGTYPFSPPPPPQQAGGGGVDDDARI